MKHILTLLVTIGTCFASPILYTDQAAFTTAMNAVSINPTVTGAAQYIGADTYYLSLDNNPGTCCDAFVTLAFSQPMYAVGFWLNNLPLLPGTGILVGTNSGDVGPFGDGTVFVSFVGLTFQDPVTQMTLSTMAPHFPFREEHLLLSGIVGSTAQVPEPTSWLLVTTGLVWFWIWSMRRVSKP